LKSERRFAVLSDYVTKLGGSNWLFVEKVATERVCFNGSKLKKDLIALISSDQFQLFYNSTYKAFCHLHRQNRGVSENDSAMRLEAPLFSHIFGVMNVWAEVQSKAFPFFCSSSQSPRLPLEIVF
jgi:hypothetical protein